MSYPFEVMDLDAIAEFLSAPRHALVATNRKGRAPQISPVWYFYDGKRIYFSVLTSTAKRRNLSRDPQVSICIDGGHPDARSVVIYGTAEILNATEEAIEEMQRRIARRYMSSDDELESYLDKAAAAGDSILFSVEPEKIIARNYN
jgi:PPOX class probable F420-dependent enzyme